jgi:transcriptional regulator
MSLSSEGRKYHAIYEALDLAMTRTVDNAVDALFDSLERAGVKVKYDDRAEELVAMVVRFIEQSSQE